MTKSSGKSDARGWKLAASMWALSIGAGFGLAGTAEAVVTPDTVPPDSIVDTGNDRPYIVGLGIRTEAGNAGGSCTGLLINPRTVLFAAHCVDGLNPDAYDGDAPGNRAQVGYTTDPTFGRTNLREYLFGSDFGVPPGDARTIDARSVMVWYDPRSRFGPLADPNGGTFLPADIAIAGFDTPTELLGRDAQDGVGLLFSPVDRLMQVTIAGYGQAGNGMTSLRLAGTENTFFRRVATNMLGYLGSERDISNGSEPQDVSDIFNPPGLNYQDLYWMDFDDPLNRPFDTSVAANYGPPAGTNAGATTTLDFNIFNDEATANEAITAAGDSGSPLITDAYGRDVSLGVLSQGSRSFFDITGFEDDNFVHFTAFSNFGTTAGYNPLFLFWDQIVVNNPYKYVQAQGGNREWTDPTTWVQEIDPLYYTLSSHGTLRNRLPNTPALGSSDAADNIGTINPNPSPIAACAFTVCPTTGGGSQPMPDSVALPGAEEVQHGGSPPPPPPPGPSTADWLTGGLIPVGSGALTGPGTTNFVPDNTNGTAGLQNSARWFEVNLRNYGRVTLRDADIEIDRLNIRGFGAELRIRDTASLTTNLTSYLDYGRLRVDGEFNPLAFDIFLGIVEGKGTINAPGGVSNFAGVISPGGDDIGTLTINGDYAQGGYGSVLFQIGRTSTDLLQINGAADIAGNLLVQSDRRLRFGNRFTVLQASSVTGNFDRTLGSGTLLFGRTEADADSIDLVIDARRLSGYFGSGTLWGSLATALDTARASGAYNSLAGVFDRIDYIPVESLSFALPTIAPTNAFQTVPLAVGYEQDVTRGLAARATELRSGVRGMSQRSMLTGLRIAQAGVGSGEEGASGLSGGGSPLDLGDRVGVFVSGQGNVSSIGDEAYEGDRYNPASLTSMSSAEMTVGADYRVNDNFAIGIATSVSRYMARDLEDGITPLDHTGYGTMLYATAWQGGWHVDGYVGVARHDYEVSRQVGAYFGDSADAAPGAVQTLGGISAGWAFEPTSGLTVGPTIGLRYSQLRLDAYGEAGGGDLALEVDGRTLTSAAVEAAFEVSYQPSATSPFAAYGRVGFVSELGDGSDLVQAHFLAAPDVAFSLERSLSPNWVSSSMGMSYQFSNGAAAHIEATSDAGRGELSNTSMRAGLSWQF